MDGRQVKIGQHRVLAETASRTPPGVVLAAVLLAILPGDKTTWARLPPVERVPPFWHPLAAPLVSNGACGSAKIRLRQDRPYAEFARQSSRAMLR